MNKASMNVLTMARDLGVSLMMYKLSAYNHYGKLKNGNYLLYNLFSSSVAVLEKDEFELLLQVDNKDSATDNELFSLAYEQGFLVHKSEDELAKLLALRHSNNFSDKRAGFQVLPTTACNARCFYCYEHGFKTATMTPETIDATVNFILDYCQNMEEVTIAWFGGEPLTCEETIVSMSRNLIPAIEGAGKTYHANIITNGALISSANITTLVDDCRISSFQITLDGRGSEHVRRKGFLDKNISYEHILENISLVANAGAQVLVRLNVDRNNLEECLGVIDDLAALDVDKNLLWPYAAPLYSDNFNSSCFASDELNFAFEKVLKKMIDCEFIQSVDGLPMSFSNACCCAKMLNNFVISPTGEISKCEHLLNCPEEVIGTVFEGIHFNSAMAKWTCTDIPEKCKLCPELPICQAGCAAAEQRKFGYGRCSYITFIHDAVIAAADYLLSKGGVQE